MKVNEIIYMVLDEIKAHSDDSDITEGHVLFLLKKYRSLMLKKQYLASKVFTPLSVNNTQTICVTLEDYSAFDDNCLGSVRRSSEAIPNLLFEDSLKIYPSDYRYGVRFTVVSKERFPFVGHNKYLKSIIYAYLGDDHHLYLDSSRAQTQYLEKLTVTGVFEDVEEAAKLSCNKDDNSDNSCDPMQQEFPIEDSMVPELLQYVVKELLGVAYRPKDTLNDAADNLSSIARFLANNVKSDLAKKIDGTE